MSEQQTQAPASKPKQPFNNLTPKQQKAVWIALPIVLFVVWFENSKLGATTDAGAAASSAAVAISYCEQTIKSCQSSNARDYDCLLTNGSSAAIDPTDLHIAYYDSNGVILRDDRVEGSIVYPGQPGHIRFFKWDNVASAKICSSDPNDPLTQSSIPFKPVG